MDDIFPVDDSLKQAQSFLQRNTRRYEAWMESAISVFIDLGRRFVSQVDLSTGPDLQGWECIRNLEDFVDSLRRQIDSTREQVDEMLNQLDISAWEKSFNCPADPSETALRLGFPDSVFEPPRETGLFRRLYYRLRWGEYSLRQYLTRKKPETAQFLHSGRIFSRPSFWTGFIQLPAFEHLSRDWNTTMISYTRSLKVFQEETTQIITAFCHALEPFDSMFARKEKLNATVAAVFNSYPSKIARIRDEMRGLKKELRGSRKQFSEQTAATAKKYLGITGSFLYPAGRLDSKKLRRRRNRQLEKQTGRIAVWKDYLDGLFEEWQKDMELDSLQLRMVAVYLKTAFSLHDEVDRKIRPVLDEVSKTIQGTLDRFSAPAARSGIRDLKNQIHSGHKDLLRILQQDLLPRLLENVSRFGIEKIIDGYVDGIASAAGRIADEHVVLIENKELVETPGFKTVNVPLKELVMEEFIPRIRQTGIAVNQHAAEQIRVISRQITSLDQIVEYNLEEALNLLRNDDRMQHEKAVDIAEEGLERAINYVSEIIRKTEQCVGDAESRLSAGMLETLNGLDELSDSERILRLKLRLARAKFREDFIEFRKKLWNYIKKLLPAVWERVSRIGKRINRLYNSARRLSGLEMAEEAQVDLAHFALDLTEQKRRLPYIYQRLFRIEPLEDLRFFTARDSILEQVSRHVEFFRQGESMMIAFTGEMGNGKSTLVNLLDNNALHEMQVIRIDFNKTVIQPQDLLDMLKDAFRAGTATTWTELQQAVQDEEDHRICIIENVHRTFLRIVDGFDGIDRLLRFMNATRERVFWMVTCGLHGWNYLDTVIQITRYFDRIYNLEQLTAAELTEMILKRHQVSGVMLTYDASPKLQKSRTYRRLTSEEQRQAWLQKRFFEQLASVSRGNITAALLYWQKAILQSGDDDMHIVSDLTIDSSALFHLAPDELFTLAALVQHEKLSAAEHGLIFDQTVPESEQILESLFHRGYLSRKEGRYAIFPVLFGAVVKNLQSRQILQ